MTAGTIDNRFGFDPVRSGKTTVNVNTGSCCGGQVCFCGKSSSGSTASSQNSSQCCGGSVCFCGKASSKVPPDIAFAARGASGGRVPEPLKLAAAITGQNRALQKAEGPYQQAASQLLAARDQAAARAGVSPVTRQALRNHGTTDHLMTLELGRLARTVASGAAHDAATLAAS